MDLRNQLFIVQWEWNRAPAVRFDWDDNFWMKSQVLGNHPPSRTRINPSLLHDEKIPLVSCAVEFYYLLTLLFLMNVDEDSHCEAALYIFDVRTHDYIAIQN